MRKVATTAVMAAHASDALRGTKISVEADMAMLAMTNGMERDLDEFDALFAASGWRREQTYPVVAGYFGLELVAV
jgi:hypothetical protein